MPETIKLSPGKIFCQYCRSNLITYPDILNGSSICNSCSKILDETVSSRIEYLEEFPPTKIDKMYISKAINFWPKLDPLQKQIFIQKAVRHFDDTFILLQELWDLFSYENKYDIIAFDLKTNHSFRKFSYGDIDFNYNDDEQPDDDKYLITGLFLTSLGLKSIPKTIRLYKHINYLRLSNNAIKKIPDFLGELQLLESLSLSNNKVQSVPDSLSKLTNLKFIYLDHNRFTNFPEVITRIPSLEFLKLTANKLQEIPKSVGNLVNLKYLDFRNNLIGNLPNLIKLSNLELLLVSGNTIDKNTLYPVFKDLPELYHTDVLLSFSEVLELLSMFSHWKIGFIHDHRKYEKRLNALIYELGIRMDLGLYDENSLTAFWKVYYPIDIYSDELDDVIYELYNFKLLKPGRYKFSFNFYFDSNLESKLE